MQERSPLMAFVELLIIRVLRNHWKHAQCLEGNSSQKTLSDLTHTRAHVHTHTHTHMRTHAEDTRVHAHIHTYIYTQARTHTHTPTFTGTLTCFDGNRYMPV